eukprot:jgi/Mesvir1/4227/Mv25871-RA.1
MPASPAGAAVSYPSVRNFEYLTTFSHPATCPAKRPVQFSLSVPWVSFEWQLIKMVPKMHTKKIRSDDALGSKKPKTLPVFEYSLLRHIKIERWSDTCGVHA